MLQCLCRCVNFSYIRLKLNEVSGHGKQRRKIRLHWVRWNLERPFGNAGLRDRLGYRIPHRSRHSFSNRFDVISLTAHNSCNSGGRSTHHCDRQPTNPLHSHWRGFCIFYQKIKQMAQSKIFSVSIFIATPTTAFLSNSYWIHHPHFSSQSRKLHQTVPFVSPQAVT